MSDPNQIARDMAYLQKSMHRHIPAGTITGCSTMLHELFGNTGFGRKYVATGGACKVAMNGQTTEWFICNDDGVGNFAALTSRMSSSPSPIALAHFTHDYCVGG